MGSFQGLELARKALFAQQGALYTTGHNIANVNTDGYSRQRVNFETDSSFPQPSRFMPNIPGQVGTGVNIGTVQRIREHFLDMQYRAENSRSQYWDTKSEAIKRMENVLNEPSEEGLNAQMDLLWQSIEDLVNDSDNSGARAVVAQRALGFTETFNHLSKSLQAIRKDLKDQIDVSVKSVNSLMEQIHNLNEQIKKIEPHGMLANDLYDERDRLIDNLSEYMNVKVSYESSGGNSLDIADGLATIEVLDSSGQSFDPPIVLVDATDKDNLSFNELEIGYDDEGLVSSLTVDGGSNNGNRLADIVTSDGRLNGLMESYGYDGGIDNLYPAMLQKLDDMAAAFANAFNAQHAEGIDKNGVQGTDAFFVIKEEFLDPDNPNETPIFTAENITVSEEIMEDPNRIAAAEVGGGSRNGNNAFKLLDVFDEPLGDLEDTSVRQHYIAVIGELGVQGQKANTMKNSTETLKAQIDNSRMSVTAVSLDEEISNLIKFQHAYNAAARSLTAVDELLDKVINQMGLVGR
ncbi:MAG TPA: flagellar hook-associated protein FlgK [Pseudogracilibacillus sp.]|nr:flagellar hook-associated protein FlgK [Pseudogracilibacillus sp.]